MTQIKTTQPLHYKYLLLFFFKFCRFKILLRISFQNKINLSICTPFYFFQNKSDKEIHHVKSIALKTTFYNFTPPPNLNPIGLRKHFSPLARSKRTPTSQKKAFFFGGGGGVNCFRYFPEFLVLEQKNIFGTGIQKHE